MKAVRAAWVIVTLVLVSNCAPAAVKRNRRKAAKPTINPAQFQKAFTSLARQVMALQDYVDAHIRTEGNSGIKQVRHFYSGTRPYYSSTHSGTALASMHDHAPNVRTIGMGEFVATLNGVEFRTRHNDYQLVMPHSTSDKLHATEPIPFPDVPKRVLDQKTVPNQVKEMQEWFRAWKDQNITHRDYRNYFRPVLCYLEGAWTKSSKSLQEPFSSERHFIEAKSWHDLTEKVRFNAQTGRKNANENLAYLPTKLVSIMNASVPVPVVAQWNYRILCNPIKGDLPFNRFRVVDDMTARMKTWSATPLTLEQLANGKDARFSLDPLNNGRWARDRPFRNGLLDELMYQIPGKDNVVGKIKDDAFDQTAYQITNKNALLNAARYHRWFYVAKTGASGTDIRSRGFSDDTLFVALTKQPNIADVSMEYCNAEKVCKPWTQRVSYAIPLEIIYLTPLSKWNPYRLQYKGYHWKSPGKSVNAGGRNGEEKKEKAYNGTNTALFFQTPNEFFDGFGKDANQADTTPTKPTGVLDRNGNVRSVRPSGHYIFLPNIPGVGRIRQRYPIIPVHGFGSSVWKELEAFKDYLAHEDD